MDGAGDLSEMGDMDDAEQMDGGVGSSYRWG